MKRHARWISPGRRVGLSAAFFLGSLVFGPSLVAAEVPTGLVAFFDATACPSGWKIASYASGRLIVAVSDGDAVGKTVVEEPLGNIENRTHQHAYSGEIKIGSRSITAVNGCCNDRVTGSGDHGYSGFTEPAASGLPFVQFPICEKE